MSATLAAWWANPFTAVLIAIVMLLLLAAVVAGFVAVLRLGAIQLGGLLAQRTALLPGYPRRGDGHASLVVFMLFGVGLVWLGFALAVVRAALLSGAGLRISLGLSLVAWVAVFAVALLLVRGLRVEPLAAFALATLGPFTPLLSAVARWEGQADEPGSEDEAVDEHEVQAFIGAGEEAGILEREDAELVASIVDFSDTVAREIMTPRTDVVALPVDAEFETVARRFAESMFTRLPVYRETLDRIEGLLHVKDVLRATQAGTRPPVAELMHPVLVVPETKQLRELLREFQASRQQLAVLVDEYGGTSGIATLEDVLEEIVGEIQDEHQREQPDVQPDGEGAFLVRGTAHIEELEELFGVAVGEAGFDSVAGLVLDRLGHLPRPGEKVSWHGLELEAVEVDRRRLRRLRIRRAGAGR
jgi:CBS domain containing-hemolysin-like protein